MPLGCYHVRGARLVYAAPLLPTSTANAPCIYMCTRPGTLSREPSWLPHFSFGQPSPNHHPANASTVSPPPCPRVRSPESPDPATIPSTDLVGVTVTLITCCYKQREFIRVGYYVNNEHNDPAINAEIQVRAWLFCSVLFFLSLSSVCFVVLLSVPAWRELLICDVSCRFFWACWFRTLCLLCCVFGVVVVSAPESCVDGRQAVDVQGNSTSAWACVCVCMCV